MHDNFYYVIVYLSFFALLILARKFKGLRLFDDNGVVANFNMLMILHISGIFLFGIVPLVLHESSPLFYGDVSVKSLPLVVISMVVMLFIILTPRIVDKKIGKSTNSWSLSLGTSYLATYFLVRIVFIAAYENWFRGYLLSDSVVALGVIEAIILNVCLYALLHIVNGRQEIIACFPFGILLCCLCIWVHAAWPAIVVHLALTVPYEIGFVRKIKKTKTLSIEDIHNRSIGISR